MDLLRLIAALVMLPLYWCYDNVTDLVDYKRKAAARPRTLWRLAATFLMVAETAAHYLVRGMRAVFGCRECGEGDDAVVAAKPCGCREDK